MESIIIYQIFIKVRKILLDATIYKHVVEKKDPSIVARETNHSQPPVDKYLKDFNRVKTLVNDNKDINFIHHTTNIARPVIKQYLQIINKYVKEL